MGVESEQLRDIGPMDPRENVGKSHVRAQCQLDGVVAILKSSGAERVLLETDGKGGTEYTIVPKGVQNGYESSLSNDTTPPNSSRAEFQLDNEQTPPKATDREARQKKGKSHDLSRHTGWFRGTYYYNGEPQRNKRRSNH